MERFIVKYKAADYDGGGMHYICEREQDFKTFEEAKDFIKETDEKDEGFDFEILERIFKSE